MKPIPTSIYLAGLPSEVQASLLGALEDLALQRVTEPPPRAPEGAGPPVAVVALNGHADGAFALISRLSAAGARVAVVGPAKDPDLILRAMRAGAREFTVAGDAKRLEHAVRTLVRPAPGSATGSAFAMFPAKGGMGATTLAVNIAAALAARDRTCVVDLDLQLGDVASSLDLECGYTITDVLANVRRLDRELLDASVPRHRSGLCVLSQVERLEESEQIGADAVHQLLPFVRSHFAQVVIDGIRGFDDLSLAALDAVDRVVIAVTQEVPAVRNAQRCVAVFQKLGYPPEKLVLVVNRYAKASSISLPVVADTVGIPVAATIANDFAAVARSVHRGVTLVEDAPRSPATRDIRALAAALGGADEAEQGRGVLGRLFGKR